MCSASNRCLRQYTPNLLAWRWSTCGSQREGRCAEALPLNGGTRLISQKHSWSPGPGSVCVCVNEAHISHELFITQTISWAHTQLSRVTYSSHNTFSFSSAMQICIINRTISGALHMRLQQLRFTLYPNEQPSSNYVHSLNLFRIIHNYIKGWDNSTRSLVHVLKWVSKRPGRLTAQN